METIRASQAEPRRRLPDSDPRESYRTSERLGSARFAAGVTAVGVITPITSRESNAKATEVVDIAHTEQDGHRHHNLV